MTQSKNSLFLFLGFGVLAVLFGLGVACGGSQDGAPSSQAQIQGSIDSSILNAEKMSQSQFVVFATQPGSDFERQGELIAGLATEDPVYRVASLEKGKAYKVSVYRVVGFNRIEIFSTALIASENTGQLNILSKSYYKRQINLASSYVSAVVEKSTLTNSTNFATELITKAQQVLGPSVTLDQSVGDYGKLSLTSGRGIACQSLLYRGALAQLLYNALVAVELNDAELDQVAPSLLAHKKAVVAASTTEAMMKAGALLKTGLEKLGDARLSAALKKSDLATGYFCGNTLVAYTNNMLDRTNYATNLLSLELTQAALNDTAVSLAEVASSAEYYGADTALAVSEFEKKAPSQGAFSTATATVFNGVQAVLGVFMNAVEFAPLGTANSRSGSEFKVSSLGPVLELKLAKLPRRTISSSLILTIRSDDGKTLVSSSEPTQVSLHESSDGLSYYYQIHKSDSEVINPVAELSPGGNYAYTLAPTTGINLQDNGRPVASLTGRLLVTPITLTLPSSYKATESDAITALNSTYRGVRNFKDQSFLVHSDKDLYEYFATGTSTIDRVGPLLQKLNLSLNSTTVATANILAKTTFLHDSAKAFRFTPSGFSAVSGAYQVEIAFNGLHFNISSLAVAVTSKDYPSSSFLLNVID